MSISGRHPAPALGLVLMLLAGAAIAPARAVENLPDPGWWNSYRNAGYPDDRSRLIVHDNELVVTAGQYWHPPSSLHEGPLGWDGRTWRSVRGLGHPTIREGGYWRGQLVAIGIFYGLPDRTVAVFRDGDWRSLGGPSPAEPIDLVSDGDRLFLSTEDGLYEWDGQSWARFGAPVRPSGSIVIVGGDPVLRSLDRRTLVRWQAGEWRSIPSPVGFNGLMLSVGNALVTATATRDAVGSDPGAAVERTQLQRWDGGRWQPLGPELGARVNQLLEWNGVVYAAAQWGPGYLTPTEPSGVYRLDASGWTLAGGVVGGSIEDIAVFEGRLVALGPFNIAGTAPAGGLAVLDGDAWRAIELSTGADAPVRAFLEQHGHLVAGGSFTHLGGVVCAGLAVNDGIGWRPFDADVDDAVLALADYRGDLVAAGDFHRAGDAATERIALWDGRSWRPLGAGFDDRVLTLAVWNDELYAGGWFTRSGNVECRGLARWDGAAWQPVGGGVRGRVMALATDADALVVGGDFKSTGGAAVRYLARWDGARWSAFPDPPPSPVTALARWGSSLAVGGFFRPVAGAVDTGSGLRLWDGRHWSAPPALGDRGWVTSLGTWRGQLVVGRTAGARFDVGAGNLAIWDGGVWSVPATAAGGSVLAVADWKGSLVLGGSFAEAGGHRSDNIARWDDALVSAPLLGSSAVRSGTRVRLSWSSDGPTNRVGFEVHRQPADAPRTRLGFVPTRADGRYEFLDPAPGAGASDYWLLDVGPFGAGEWRGPIHIDPLPAGLSVGVPWPNPFRAAATIRFTLARPERVVITVLDAQGRLVRELFDAFLRPGEHDARWDGAAGDGGAVAAGLYWIHVRAGDDVATRRVLRLK